MVRMSEAIVAGCHGQALKDNGMADIAEFVRKRRMSAVYA